MHQQSVHAVTNCLRSLRNHMSRNEPAIRSGPKIKGCSDPKGTPRCRQWARLLRLLLELTKSSRKHPPTLRSSPWNSTKSSKKNLPVLGCPSGYCWNPRKSPNPFGAHFGAREIIETVHQPFTTRPETHMIINKKKNRDPFGALARTHVITRKKLTYIPSGLILELTKSPI